jgi:glycosyltransferase involved in cell wall biosynthesis
VTTTVALVVEPVHHRVPGGTGRYTAELARALSQRPDVAVVGVSAAHRPGATAGAGLPRAVRCRSFRLPRPVLYEAWSRSGRPGLGRLAPEADVVHATTVLAPTSDRRPLVATVHDLLFADPAAGFGGRVSRMLARGWARTAVRADVVVCPSRSTAEAVHRQGVTPDRIRVVAEGVAPVPLDPVAVSQALAGLGIDRPYVLWVGTVEPRKNLVTVLDAFASVAPGRDHLLVVAGPDGWGPGADELVRRSIVPADRARVLGRVRDDVLAALYTGASVLCWPSLAEGFGLPVLEAQGYGTPVVTSAGTAQAELVEGGGLLVGPTDVAAMAEALAHVLDDDADRQRMSAAARRTASRYTWERAARETAAVYEEVVS